MRQIGGKMNRTAYPIIDMKATGERIRQLRKERGIKVSELTEYMGFNEPQAIYKWQRGESLPTVDNLYALSKILNTKIEDILIGDDGMSSPLLEIFFCHQF
jgi:transcriptional regulator with XRE-family HTH domain